MNQHTLKIDEVNFHCDKQKYYPKALVLSLISAFLLLQGCFLTQTQALTLQTKIEKIEDEMSKMQSLKHDLEIFMNDQVKMLIEKVAYLDSQVSLFKTNLEEAIKEKEALVIELQKLTQETEINKQSYENLLQTSLKNETKYFKNAAEVLQESQSLIKEQKLVDAINLLEDFIKKYPHDEQINKLNHSLAKILTDFSKNELNQEKKALAEKIAVIIYKNLLQNNELPKEDLLYDLGFLLKDMKNYAAAIGIFKELSQNKTTAKTKEALKQIAELEKKK